MNKKIISFIFIIPALSLITLTIITPLFLMIRVSSLKPPEGTGFYIPYTFSLHNYQSVFDTYGVNILIDTTIFALEVSLCSILFGFGFAILMQELTNLWRIICFICLLLPKFISPLIVVFGIQRLLGNYGLINETLITTHLINEPLDLNRNHISALIGEIYLTIPFVTLFLFSQLNSINKETYNAAKGLGANNYQVFRKITLPMCYPGIIIIWQLSIAWNLGSFLGPLFLGNPSNTTISCEIYHQAFEIGNWPLAATWGVLMTAIIMMFLWLPKLTISFIFKEHSK
jgi:ABC-type glycerol-3-phosphate transport system permease component